MQEPLFTFQMRMWRSLVPPPVASILGCHEHQAKACNFDNISKSEFQTQQDLQQKIKYEYYNHHHPPSQLLDVHSSSGPAATAHGTIHTPSCRCLHWPGIGHQGTTAAHKPPVSDQWACRCDVLPPARHDGGCVLILSHWGEEKHYIRVKHIMETEVLIFYK